MPTTADQASAELAVLYAAVLGRQPDAAAVAALVPALEAGLDPNALRAQLALGSGEATADVASLYAAELGRAPDSAGLAAFLEALATGSLSLAGVRTALAAAPEAANAVDVLYQQVLGRPADPAGEAQFVAALASGFSLGEVRQQLAQSPEAANALSSLYQTVLNRPIDPGGLASYTALLQSGASLNDVRVDLARSPEAAATLTRTYELTFGSAPAATTIAAQETELALGRPFSGTTEATQSSQNASMAALVGPYYYYNIPAQYTATGLSSSIVVADDNSAIYNSYVTSIPTPVMGATPGPDTIVLDLQTINPSTGPISDGSVPITFVATLDGTAIGNATVTSAYQGSTQGQTQDQVIFTGSFGTGLHDLHLQIVADPGGSVLNVVSGATYDGNKFLIGAVQSNAAGSIDIFPHPGPQPTFLPPA